MEFHVERTIEASAAEVAPFFFDATNNPSWQGGMKSCEWTTEPPIAMGSIYEQVAEFRGKPVNTTFEVTEYQPDRIIRIESIESTFPIQVTRRVEPLDSGRCRVSADISGQPGGALRVLTMVGKRVAKRSIETDYDRLVEYFRENAV